ncbi:MAG: T9SS type A sorting domain-containing protein [Saprospiraceae bacterium]
MKNFTLLLLCTLFSSGLYSQIPVDLVESVPAWLSYDVGSNEATLKWIGDQTANQYTISELEYDPNILTNVGTTDGATNEYALGSLATGEQYEYQIRKSGTASANGVGILSLGLEVPATHDRGRCLLAIDDTLSLPLQLEISRLIKDLEMDGWEVNTLQIMRTETVVGVKAKILNWYEADYELSQSLFILGRVAVPYSGNKAHDGHGDHQGAWAADVFYGELDGNWTDVTVNNSSPTRAVNKNIPGDGKYDQTSIPGQVELEVGRVDFHNMPAFAADEIELTRQYLNKNHEFRIGNKNYPRRAIVENNFSSLSEGFGQSGWRNFTTMFGGDSVSVGNYDAVLATEKYLCSYACGGGSYVSASGIGSTNNLWVAKEMKTVFTMNFGSYFGDWDSQNNFLRAALGSGDVLTNAWAGRPVWHFYPMALGKHIGFCTQLSQNATGLIFSQGASSRGTHMALMGDPMLRLHAMQPAGNLSVDFVAGDHLLNWSASTAASEGYFVYRKMENGPWELITSFHNGTSFTDPCVASNTNFEYMVKAIRLEHTGSGSYYNTSLGITASITSGNNPALVAFFIDLDGDGFGSLDQDTMACFAPMGFVENDLDCDDNNASINPDGLEIANNNIDEDCDGGDLLVGLQYLNGNAIKIYPNPAQNRVFVEMERSIAFQFRISNVQGQILQRGGSTTAIALSSLPAGLYYLEIVEKETKERIVEKLIIEK